MVEDGKLVVKRGVEGRMRSILFDGGHPRVELRLLD
jgi:hypothetical protein